MPGDIVSILLTVVASLHGRPPRKWVSSICSCHAAGWSRHQAVRSFRAVYAVVTLVSPRQTSTRQLYATAGYSTRSLGTARVPFRAAVAITFPACAELRFYPRSGPVWFRVGFESANVKMYHPPQSRPRSVPRMQTNMGWTHGRAPNLPHGDSDQRPKGLDSQGCSCRIANTVQAAPTTVTHTNS